MNVETDFFFTTMIKEGLHRNKHTLQFKLETLFKGVDFTNKRVIDIGGGKGRYSFYAAFKGAEHVTCIEPEAQGSTSQVTGIFKKAKDALNYNNVTLEPITFQEFDPREKLFDIILLHNSINHLNENACINMLTDKSARTIYRDIFLKIYSLASRNAKLIICDCSRNNFFAQIGIRNPIAPSIEWHKHQAPEMWAGLLQDVGFVNPNIRWTSFDQLGRLGNILIGNKIAAYFLVSHFCLTMEKI